MTMLLHSTTSNDGLFDLLGLAFYALDTLNTARGTTVPTEFNELATAAELLNGATGTPATAAAQDAVAGFADAVTAWQADQTLTTALCAAAENLVIAFCQADNPNLAKTLSASLNYLITQMAAGTVTGGDHVTAASPTIAVTNGSSNSGDVGVAATLLRGDGQTNQNAVAETITLTASNAAAAPQYRTQFAFRRARPHVQSLAWRIGNGRRLQRRQRRQQPLDERQLRD